MGERRNHEQGQREGVRESLALSHRDAFLNASPSDGWNFSQTWSFPASSSLRGGSRSPSHDPGPSTPCSRWSAPPWSLPGRDADDGAGRGWLPGGGPGHSVGRKHQGLWAPSPGPGEAEGPHCKGVPRRPPGRSECPPPTVQAASPSSVLLCRPLRGASPRARGAPRKARTTDAEREAAAGTARAGGTQPASRRQGLSFLRGLRSALQLINPRCEWPPETPQERPR